MKWTGLSIALLFLLLVGCFKKQDQEDVRLILNSVAAAAQASYREKGTYDFKSFDEMGFAPAGRLDILIRYSGSKDDFTISAVHKKTGYAATKKRKVGTEEGDLLKDNPQVIVYEQK